MIKTKRDGPVPKGWIKGSDIPHLVDAEFYEMYYDPEEVKMMEEMERGERIPVPVVAPKRKSITLRVFEDDLEKIKYFAREEGIPYQTLITSLLHKIANKKISINVE